MSLLKILNKVESVGNKLPPPSILFLYLCGVVILSSALAALFSVQALHPISQQQIEAVNLLSQHGLHKILTQTVSNFVNFAPVGTVLVAILGIGVADKSGLINTLLHASVVKAPPKMLTLIVVLAGILSNIAQDAGYVVLIPLAALIFKSLGRNPLTGMAAAFAGVSGGYSANFLIGPVDTILAGISSEAAQTLIPNYEVSAAGNYYFMLASTFVIAAVGTWVTEKWIAPIFDKDVEGNISTSTSNAINLTNNEKRGLKAVGIFSLCFIGIILLGLIPQSGILRSPETGQILGSPFIKGIVTIVAFYSFVCGVIYGRFAKTIINNHQLTNAMDSTMATMASYLVLTFFAAQFVNYFNWSQLGIIFAINGANILQSLAIHPTILLLVFIVIAAFLNLLIGSASAKWALTAPIFVPMLILLGISPEAAQVAFRIGDSSTNIITPLMPYFGVIMAYVMQYKKDAGSGTIIAMMLPYSVAFLLCWSAMLVIWFAFDLPLGPGAGFIAPPLTTGG